MEQETALKGKRETIIRHLPGKRAVKVSFSSTKMSVLEAIIGRADRRFSSVIYRAYTKGAMFDGERNRFSWRVWEEAMREEGIDYRLYLDAQTENFPWSFIRTDQRLKTKD